MATTYPLIVFRMRWMSAAAVSGALVLAVLVALTAGAADDLSIASAGGGSATADKVGSSLVSVAAERPGKRTQVVVRMARGASTAHGRALVARLGGKAISSDLAIINGFGAELRAADARRLAADPDVEAVSLNGRLTPESVGATTSAVASDDDCSRADATTDPMNYPIVHDGDGSDVEDSLRRLEGSHIHSLDADAAWDHATGVGVGVAVVDTGIAPELPDFRVQSDKRDSRVIASAVVNPCARESTDNYGHGTHVAGLIAGNSTMLKRKDRSYGKHMGVAPEANLISVKVADEDGYTTVLDVINGLQFAVDYKAELGIRVVNLSLSSTVPESYRTDPLDAAVEQAWLQGLVVVAAPGNDGAAPDAVSYAPGNDPYAITAGAVDDRGTRTVADDVLAPWSSRGVTQDGFTKPEVLAPGRQLTATLARDSDLEDLCESCVVDKRYFRMGGTSMSTALVSGVAALLLQEHPDWTPDQVKGALQSTLTDVPGVGGEVNAMSALRATRLTSNVGLVPNELITPETGLIDYSRASFRRASFRDAGGSKLDSKWSRASFRCDCPSGADGADPSRASYRRASYRRTASLSK